MMVNDEKILALKQKIEEKKKSVNHKFVPVTNCALTLDGVLYNLHAVNDKNLLRFLLIKLTVLNDTAMHLALDNIYMQDGFVLGDWIIDVESKLRLVSNKEEVRELKVMEDKLTQLLSNDKKTELELDSIESALGKL